MSITWRDHPITTFSEYDAQRRFFRIDRDLGDLVPRYTLTWLSKPSTKKHSKITTLRIQKDIRDIVDAKKLAEEWNHE